MLSTTAPADTKEITPTSIEDLLFALEEAIPDRPAAIAFDADGTLWSGDVGEDMFQYALEQKLLRPSALPALAKVAATYEVEQCPEPNQQGRLLFSAFLRGQLPEPGRYQLAPHGVHARDRDVQRNRPGD